MRALAIIAIVCSASTAAIADGLLVKPKRYLERPYSGSLEERGQEAIIIFHAADTPGGSTQDIILKISVEGEVDNFGWVIAFPNEPKIAKESPLLFRELHAYVEARKAAMVVQNVPSARGQTKAAKPSHRGIEVISRKVVGSFETAVVRETEAGALRIWLEAEGFQAPDGLGELASAYRLKGYVFACIKVSDVELKKGTRAAVHPLRFSFKTGGRDGIYFPMKMTGLQTASFDVNLYVFYGKWINDRLSKFGYVHRGFSLRYRDWDTRQCEPDAGKAWSDPAGDPFLRSLAHKIPTVTKFFQKLHPGEKYYLTNIQAWGLRPEDVRDWSDDLWLFPYYTDKTFIPYDARAGGTAAAAWPGGQGAGTPDDDGKLEFDLSFLDNEEETVSEHSYIDVVWIGGVPEVVALVFLAVGIGVAVWIARRRRSGRKRNDNP